MLALFKDHIVLSLYFRSRDHIEVSPSITYQVRHLRLSKLILVYTQIPITGHFLVVLLFSLVLLQGSTVLFFNARWKSSARNTKVLTTLNIFLRSPLTLLHWSLEIITKISREYHCSYTVWCFYSLLKFNILILNIIKKSRKFNQSYSFFLYIYPDF